MVLYTYKIYLSLSFSLIKEKFSKALHVTCIHLNVYLHSQHDNQLFFQNHQDTFTFMDLLNVKCLHQLDLTQLLFNKETALHLPYTRMEKAVSDINCHGVSNIHNTRQFYN